MGRDVELGDLKLIVRALHQDVSEMDARLQMLESEIRRLHEALAGARDVVILSKGQRERLGA